MRFLPSDLLHCLWLPGEINEANQDVLISPGAAALSVFIVRSLLQTSVVLLLCVVHHGSPSHFQLHAHGSLCCRETLLQREAQLLPADTQEAKLRGEVS